MNIHISSRNGQRAHHNKFDINEKNNDSFKNTRQSIENDSIYNNHDELPQTTKESEFMVDKFFEKSTYEFPFALQPERLTLKQN